MAVEEVTGAVAGKKGRFELADGGTLFLDEIGELPQGMQVKLLRVLQNRQFEPVGSNKTVTVDTRVVLASNKDIEEEVKQGRFRQDLYYRINVIELTIPSLRERKEDIPLFIEMLLKSLSEKMGVDIPDIEKDAINALQNYPFPGNVRELENILERAIALSDNNIISKHDLHLKARPVNETAEADIPEITPVDLMDLAGQERHSIMQALEQTRWNKTAAAKLLGLSLRQLRYRLQKLDIE